MKVVPLGEVAEVVMGQSPPGSSYNSEGTGVPLLNGPTEFGPNGPTAKQWTTEPKRFAKPGDILFCVRGATAGRMNWSNGDYAIGRGLAAIRGRDTDPGYLYRLLDTWYRLFQARGTGSTFINISRKDLNNLPIPLPPIEEQRRIAAVLDAADALRVKRRQALAKLDTLTQAIFIDMFGDLARSEDRALGVALSEQPVFGTMIPGSLEGEYLDLRVANIQNGRLTLDDSKYVDLPQSAIPKHVVESGDLLMARAIASLDHLGKCIVAEPGGEKWAFDSHLMRIRLDSDLLLPVFLKAWLSSAAGRASFLRIARRSSVQFNVNTKEIARLKVPFPSVTAQQEFAGLLRQKEHSRYLCESELSRLDTLFASLQQRAFRGEL